MIARFGIGLALLAGPALALEPAGQCAYDPETHRVVEWSLAETNAGNLFDAFVSPEANGFVSTVAATPTGAAIVLNHCPTGDFLVLVVPEDHADAVVERFYDMMDEARGYTPIQISNELMGLGAFARMGEGGVGGCDCLHGWNG